VNKQIFGYDVNKARYYENGFYLTSHPSLFSKALSHWELYKKIINLPGEIVECGTFKGASFIRFATYREMLESQYSRKLISFDAFGKFPKTQKNNKDDADFIDFFELSAGDGIPKEELESALTEKKFNNFELIKGNVLDTLPVYINENPQLKIALLHIDLDVYDATKCALEYLYKRVVYGGIIVLDDYASVSGANRAVDEFILGQQGPVEIHKLPYRSTPCFIVKNEYSLVLD
jgi:predicted O-methyltransferase YrrM